MEVNVYSFSKMKVWQRTITMVVFGRLYIEPLRPRPTLKLRDKADFELVFSIYLFFILLSILLSFLFLLHGSMWSVANKWNLEIGVELPKRCLL